MSEAPSQIVCTCADLLMLQLSPEEAGRLLHFKAEHKYDCGAERCGGCARCIIDQVAYSLRREE